jgi:hypothetical protein
MSDKKNKDVLGTGSSNKQIVDDSRGGTAASRARNKTVMLSPEMTGQVRAMLQDDTPRPERKRVEDDWGTRESTTPRNPMDSLFSGPDRFEPSDRLDLAERFSSPERADNRSTSVLDADVLGLGYEASEASNDRPVFDPLTSLVSAAPPMSGRMRAEPVIEEDHFEPEPVPAPAVEQPASAGFGASRAASPAPAAKPAPAPRKAVAAQPDGWHAVVSLGQPGRLVGLLVSYDRRDQGEIFEIRSGRFLITSRPTDNGDYLLIDDDTVSPLHAIVRATEEGKIQVLDQLSEFGTGLQRTGATEEEEVAGGLATVAHGDTLRFGKRFFVVVTIPKVAKTAS